jgi:hypothetical protein
MEFNNPIASRAVVDQLANACWQVDPKFQILGPPLQKVEIDNDLYERKESYIEFDPYDAEVVDKGYYDNLEQQDDQDKHTSSVYNQKRGYISEATKKRRERLGLETNLPTFPGGKVRFEPVPSVFTSSRSPKSTAATIQRQGKNQSESYANVPTAETSILKSSSRGVKDYKMTPHYSETFEEQDSVVWEKDRQNLEHFKSLKQYEKLHDAKLYYNSMLPPINKKKIQKKLDNQANNFIKHPVQSTVWENNDHKFMEMASENEEFQSDDMSQTDVEDVVNNSPFVPKPKHQKAFEDSFNRK